MTLEAVRFSGGEAAVEAKLAPKSLPPPEAARDSRVTYVVCEADLDSLAEGNDCILDRGHKHPAKPLPRLLLGHEKVPLIRAGYRHAGRLTAAVRNLLEQARRRGEYNTYLIAVGEPVFRQLQKQAGKSAGAAAVAQPGGAMSPQQILDLLPDCEIPEDLEATFAGESVNAQLVRKLIVLAAAVDTPVLILGDSGTGKELVANAIHRHSRRGQGPIVPVNCGAIPSELLESVLFGQLPGVATATRAQTGLWEVARYGTLFLDEIGDLRLDHQVKIVRALQTGKIRKIGGREEIPVSARIIAATNRDLFSMMRAGQFREDLYYRLRRFLIRTPSLREIPDQVPWLAAAMWRKIAGEKARTLPEEILRELHLCPWPGNVRDLKSALSLLKDLFGKGPLRAEHLRAVIQMQGPRDAAPAAGLPRAESIQRLWRLVDVVHASEALLRPAFSDGQPDPATLAALRSSIRYRRQELEVLCQPPFPDKALLAGLGRLRQALAGLESRLGDAVRARGYWHKHLAAEIQIVLSSLFGELKRLTGSNR